MKLFQKGLLLIATPMLAQFIFVLVLLFAYRTTEEMTWKDMRLKSQNAELVGITIDAYRAIGVLTTYGFTQDTSMLPIFDKVYESLVRKCEYLMQLENEFPNPESFKSTVESLKKMMSDLSSARQLLVYKHRQVHSTMMLANETRADMERALLDLIRLLDERSKAGLPDAEQIERRRLVFLTSVLGGFSLNMLMSAGLLALYARDFGRRFDVLVDNTERIAKGELLNKKISGEDELKELDDVIHAMNESLKIAEDRKNQLMAMVSHDLRSPLTAISLSLDIVAGGSAGPVSEGVAEKLKSTVRMTKRLTSLVNDILDLDKLRAGKLTLTLSTVDVCDLVNDCIKELEPIAQKSKVSLISRLEPNLVVADRERLAQIFVNLMGNAVKFSPPEGKVEIFCQMGEHARFCIKDQGPGVPQKYQETIFLPFEQVPEDKRPKKGSTGLGLPICKFLVELHGGQIGLDSDEKGSTFWFTLPAAEIEEI